MTTPAQDAELKKIADFLERQNPEFRDIPHSTKQAMLRHFMVRFFDDEGGLRILPEAECKQVVADIEHKQATRTIASLDREIADIINKDLDTR